MKVLFFESKEDVAAETATQLARIDEEIGDVKWHRARTLQEAQELALSGEFNILLLGNMSKGADVSDAADHFRNAEKKKGCEGRMPVIVFGDDTVALTRGADMLVPTDSDWERLNACMAALHRRVTEYNPNMTPPFAQVA